VYARVSIAWFVRPHRAAAAYTVMRTVADRTKIFRFSQHVDRMASSVTGLLNKEAKEEAGTTSPSGREKHRAQLLEFVQRPGAMHRLMTSHISNAVKNYEKHKQNSVVPPSVAEPASQATAGASSPPKESGAAAHAAAGAAASSATVTTNVNGGDDSKASHQPLAAENPNPPSEFKIMVLLTWARAAAAAAAAAASATAAATAPTTAASSTAFASSAPAAGASASPAATHQHQQSTTSSSNSNEEVHAAPPQRAEGQEEEELSSLADVIVHVSSLPPMPAPPVRASVRTAHRENAHVKDSTWATLQKQFEDAKSEVALGRRISGPRDMRRRRHFLCESLLACLVGWLVVCLCVRVRVCPCVCMCVCVCVCVCV
jgi:hypothetical protein